MLPVVNYLLPLTFISADWGKDGKKRHVHVATVDTDRRTTIEYRPCREWSLIKLLDLAEEHKRRTRGSVLIGVDLALGVPDRYWQEVTSLRNEPAAHFVDWLGERPPDFFNIQKANAPEDAADWCLDRPFFSVPSKSGGRRFFEERLRCGFRRKIDWLTGANPIWITSGIPGSVGSGTRAFWKELQPLLKPQPERDFAFLVWPFEKKRNVLGVDDGMFLVETYPALAYAAALAQDLPSEPFKISKTNPKKSRPHEREKVAARFWASTWLQNLNTGQWDREFDENEDRFDSFLTAAAVVRCVLEGRQLVDDRWIAPVAEGAMLLAGPVEPRRSARRFIR